MFIEHQGETVVVSQIVENVPRAVPLHILEPSGTNTELREVYPWPKQYVTSAHVFFPQNYYTSSPYSRSFLKVYILIVSRINSRADHHIGSCLEDHALRAPKEAEEWGVACNLLVQVG
eukprot:52547_1